MTLGKRLDRLEARRQAQRDGKDEAEAIRAVHAYVLAVLKRKHGCEDDA